MPQPLGPARTHRLRHHRIRNDQPRVYALCPLGYQTPSQQTAGTHVDCDGQINREDDVLDRIVGTYVQPARVDHHEFTGAAGGDRTAVAVRPVRNRLPCRGLSSGVAAGQEGRDIPVECLAHRHLHRARSMHVSQAPLDSATQPVQTAGRVVRLRHAVLSDDRVDQPWIRPGQRIRRPKPAPIHQPPRAFFPPLPQTSPHLRLAVAQFLRLALHTLGQRHTGGVLRPGFSGRCVLRISTAKSGRHLLKVLLGALQLLQMFVAQFVEQCGGVQPQLRCRGVVFRGVLALPVRVAPVGTEGRVREKMAHTDHGPRTAL